MTPFVITMSWPHNDLTPNGRAHWAALSRLRKAQKKEAMQLCMAAGVKRGAADERIPVLLTFCPPNRIARDTDNYHSAMKAAMDGIAEMIGVDDSLFDPVPVWGEVVKGGRVVVRVG